MMLTLQRFKEMIAAAGEVIRAGEKHFSELDAAAGGDGDHGTAIVTAFHAMAKATHRFQRIPQGVERGLAERGLRLDEHAIRLLAARHERHRA
jgi:hypothetical protein